MLSIYRQSLKRNYKASLFVGLGLGLIALLFAGLFNDFKDQLDPFVGMIPAGMEAVIGDMTHASTPEGWLSLELFPLFVPVSLAIIGIMFGANLIGREEEDGTLELLLASQKSRLQVAGQKFLTLVDLLFIPSAILFLAIALGSVMFNFHPNMWNVLAACVSGWLLGLTYGSVSFAAQGLTGRRGLAIALGSMVFGATYALTIVTRLLEDWKSYEVYSPMHYYNIPGSLVDGVDWASMGVLLLIVVIFSVVGLIGFRHRDTGV